VTRFLLVYGELVHGGIQTLIVRLANHLAEEGRAVAACIPGGELASHLAGNVEQLHWADREDAMRQAREWMRTSADPVAMISFDPISAALALRIEAASAGKVPLTHVSGVYHPRSFFMTGERLDRIWLNRLVAKAIGDPFIFYMNSECRDEHARRWGVSTTPSRIIPLPIEERPSQWLPRPSDTLRIVSVGRLVDFKAYNLAAPEIAAECRSQGIRLSWDIFGTGPLQERIEAGIARHKVADLVRLRGALSYPDFATTVVGYDLFIGMGTAALEAAMIGVPTIVATESELRRCYGFVDELPFGNVGERQSTPPPHDLAAIIQTFASMDDEQRAAVSVRCRSAVLPYDTSACVASLEALAQSPAERPSLRFKEAVSVLYEALTASRLTRLARRFRTRLLLGRER
jgi:glycosyltransferase involved in cell wall biosynthesis